MSVGALVMVCIMAATLGMLVYVAQVAYMDWSNTPCEVAHKYEGRPRGTGYYFAEFATRKEARVYARQLATQPGVTHVRVKPMPYGTFLA